MIILPAKQHAFPSKRLFQQDTDDEDEDDNKSIEEQLSSSKSNDEMCDTHAYEEEVCTSSIEKLKKTWKELSPTTEENTIIGRWHAGIHETKRSRKLYIGQLLRRFLLEEDGKVKSIKMHCLKPKVGSRTVRGHP